MLRWRSRDLRPGVNSCALIPLQDNLPYMMIWTKCHLTDIDRENLSITVDGLIDIVVDLNHLHRHVVIDALAAHFNVSVYDIEIECVYEEYNRRINLE